MRVDVGRGPDRLPTARADERHRVVAERANLGMQRGGQPSGKPVQEFGAGEQIRDDPLRAEVGIAAVHPPVPHGRQVVHQFGGVHAGEPGVVELARGHDLMAEFTQRRFDDGDAVGDLGGRGAHTEPDLRLRVVIRAMRVRRPPEFAPPPGQHGTMRGWVEALGWLPGRSPSARFPADVPTLCWMCRASGWGTRR